MKSIRLIPALSALLLAPQLHAEISPVQLVSLKNGPTENLTLNFATFKVEYTPQKPDGSGGAVKEVAWKIAENVKA